MATILDIFFVYVTEYAVYAQTNRRIGLGNSEFRIDEYILSDDKI